MSVVIGLFVIVCCWVVRCCVLFGLLIDCSLLGVRWFEVRCCFSCWLVGWLLDCSLLRGGAVSVFVGLIDRI